MLKGVDDRFHLVSLPDGEITIERINFTQVFGQPSSLVLIQLHKGHVAWQVCGFQEGQIGTS